jgi:macrophage erythroblast attacher
LRLQQYIELVRQGHEASAEGMDTDMDDGRMDGVSLLGGGEGKLVEARVHAKKFLSSTGDFELMGRAAGMLAYRPWDEVEPYAVSSLPKLPTQQLSGDCIAWLPSHHMLTTSSPSTPQPAGPTSRTSSSQHITTCTRSHPALSYTSLSPPGSPP